MKTINYRGINHQFPDDMDDAAIDAAMRKTYPEDVYEAEGGGILSSLEKGLSGLNIIPAALAQKQNMAPGAVLKDTNEQLKNLALETAVGAYKALPENPITEMVAGAFEQNDGIAAPLQAAKTMVTSPGLALDYMAEMLPGGIVGGGLGGGIAAKTLAPLARNKLAQEAAIASGVNAGATAAGGFGANTAETGDITSGLKQTAAETGVAAVMGAPMALGGRGVASTAAKVLGLNPADEMLQTLAGNAAIGRETSGGELAASALLGVPSAPVEIGMAYYLGREQQDSQAKIDTEILNMAKELGVMQEVDANGMIVMPENNHTVSPADFESSDAVESKPLAKAIPMFRDSEGNLTNETIPGIAPELIPTSGEGVRILENGIRENVENGEIALNDELADEIENGKFSNPARAVELAGEIQLRLDGVNVLHSVDELGKAKSKFLEGTETEALIAELEALKTENGLPTEVSIIRSVNTPNAEMTVEDNLISKSDELLYRMLNPLTPERKVELLAKANRSGEVANLPDDENSVDVKSLDSTWSQMDQMGLFDEELKSPDIGGITEEVQTAREDRYVPEILPPSMRTIEVSSVPETEGLTLRKIPKQAGTFGIGGNDRSFSREYKEAVVKLAEAVRKKYMAPDSMLIVNFENFAPDRDIFGGVVLDEMGNPQHSNMGAHFRLDDGTHVITPRELASWDKHKAVYNKLTVNEAIYSLTHELGHAVWLNEFYRGISPQNAALFQGMFAADDIEGIRSALELLPEDQKQVVAEWINRRDAVKTESARWFVENWLGIRKTALGVGKWKNTMEQSIYAWAERQLAASGKRLDGATALDLVHALYRDTSLSETESNAQAEKYILSFNEYMAEQFTRHAYSSKLPESTLADNAFFQRALAALRSFFRDLKTVFGGEAESVLVAGEKFEQWVSKLSHAYGNIDGVETKAKKRKPRIKGKPAAIAEPRIEAAPPEVPAVEQNPEQIEKLFKGMVPLVRKEDPTEAERLKNAIEYGDFEEAQMIVMETLGRKISFDTTYSTNLLKRLPKREKYSAKELLNFIGQSGIKKTEQLAVAELIEEFHGGEIPLEALELRVVQKLIPLDAIEGADYADHGWDEIGQSVRGTRTVILSPKSNMETFFWNHFWDSPNPNIRNRQYFGHFRTRFLKGDEFAWLLELQSDLFQRLGSKREDRADRNNDLGEANKVFAEFFPEEYALLKGQQKDFAVRLLKEANAYYVERGIKRVRLAHENTMGIAEGWIRPTDLAVIEGDRMNYAEDFSEELEGISFEINGEFQVLTGTIINGYGRTYLEASDIYGAGGEFELGNLIANIRGQEAVDKILKSKDALEKITTMRERYGEFARKLAPRYDDDLSERLVSDYSGIYKRHKELREYAEKIFGAKKIEDEKGQIWYEYEITPDMQTISLDATSPIGKKYTAAMKSLANLKSKSVNQSLNFTARAGMTLVQLQQLAATNPDIVQLGVFNKLQQGFNRLKNQLMFRAQDVVDEWLKLSTSQTELLEKLMRLESESGEHKTKLAKSSGMFTHEANAEFDNWLWDNGVDLGSEPGQQVRSLFIKIKNSHQYQFNTLEAVLRDILWKKFGRDTAVFGEKWRQYQGLFNEMRSKPFLPNMQFGNFVITVKEKVDGKLTTVFKRHYESRGDRDLAFDEMKAKAKIGEIVLREDLTDSQTVILSLPFDFVQSLADTGVFTPEQITLMQEMLIPTRVEKFEKRWREVANSIPGGSDNLFRNYSAYSWHNANFISKLKYNQDFGRAIASLRGEISRLTRTRNIEPGALRAQQDRLSRVLSLMSETKQYIMHPPAEMETVRAGISLLYLNFMVKTALMNFSTMMHTVFASQVEYGEIASSKAFGKSLWLIKNAWGSPNETGGMKFSLIEEKIKNSRGKEESYWKNIKYAMDRAVHDGVIDQSFAYFLAGLATSGTRMKMYQKYPRSRYLHSVLDAGMIPFRAIEKANRIASLLTFYQLELEKTGNPEKAYEHAAERTLVLQNDYTRGNRPKILRGKASIFTIFASYAQFMGWITTGGFDRSLSAEAAKRGEDYKGPVVNFTARMWLMYLVLGGVMGLPFAENIKDLLQFIARKFFNTADLEYEMRKFIEETTGHENVVMHGLMHRVPTGLGSVDLSASFGLGRLIPGTEPFGQWKPGMKMTDFVGKELVSLSGLTGSFVNSLWNFASGDGTKALPGIIGQVSKAIDGYENGIMTRKGVRLNRDPETGEWVEQSPAVAALQVAGFNLADVSAARKQSSMAIEISGYYAAKRSMLLANRNQSIVKGNNDMRVSAERDIRDFNESLPDEFGKLKISRIAANESLRNYRKSIKKAESGKAPSKQLRGVYSGVKEAFTESQ